MYENHNYELVNELIDYDEIRKRLYEVKPRMLIMGYSAYSRRIDFEKVRSIVDDYNQSVYYDQGGSNNPDADPKSCILWTDMAHFSLFIAAHLWKDKYDPTIWSDVVTTTTHKGLLGPRSSVILWNDDNYTKKINSAVFPGNIGGSNQAMTAAKAQCFINCLKPEFKVYAEQVYRNMQAIINGIKDIDKQSKIRFVSGGSENHMVLLDMKGLGLTGKEAESLLESYNIICNKNMISGDLKPADCTGIRIGTPAITTRGFNEEMCFELGQVIAQILLNPDLTVPEGTINLEEAIIRKKVKDMLDKVGPFYKQKYTLPKNDGPDNIIA
jgi:glycine hydroxymethyltransferase